MTPRPGKVEVPIAGEVVSRRRNDRRAKGDAEEEVAADLRTVVRLDGPAKLNWLCKALPLVKRRKVQPSDFLDIISSQRFAGNLDDVMPWGSQMVSMLRREIEDFQPQQVSQIMHSELWKRFADSDDERAVTSATSSSALPAGRAAAFAAAAGTPGPGGKPLPRTPGGPSPCEGLTDMARKEVKEDKGAPRSPVAEAKEVSRSRSKDRSASSGSSSSSSKSGSSKSGATSSSAASTHRGKIPSGRSQRPEKHSERSEESAKGSKDTMEKKKKQKSDKSGARRNCQKKPKKKTKSKDQKSQPPPAVCLQSSTGVAQEDRAADAGTPGEPPRKNSNGELLVSSNSEAKNGKAKAKAKAAVKARATAKAEASDSDTDVVAAYERIGRKRKAAERSKLGTNAGSTTKKAKKAQQGAHGSGKPTVPLKAHVATSKTSGRRQADAEEATPSLKEKKGRKESQRSQGPQGPAASATTQKGKEVKMKKEQRKKPRKSPQRKRSASSSDGSSGKKRRRRRKRRKGSSSTSSAGSSSSTTTTPRNKGSSGTSSS